MQHSIQHPLKRHGFSLIEAAIVLGIIGLVLGSIWVASAKVRQNQRVTELTKDIMQIVQKTRKLYRLEYYPATATNFSSSSVTMGIFPSSYTYSTAQSSAVSADGVVIRHMLFGGSPPQMRVLVYANGGRGSSLTVEECTQLVVRLGGFEGSSTKNLQRVQFNTVGGASLGISFPPVTLANGKCPATVGYAEFWYNP